jgi:hypothetical protein
LSSAIFSSRTSGAPLAASLAFENSLALAEISVFALEVSADFADAFDEAEVDPAFSERLALEVPATSLF